MKSRKLFQIIGIVSFVAISLLVVAPAVFDYFYRQSEVSLQRLFEAEVSQLPMPTTCTTTSSAYQQTKADLQASLRVVYSCDTTGGRAHDFIVEELKKRGYSQSSDDSQPALYVRFPVYSFLYANHQFKLNYRFFPEASVPEGGFEELQQSPARQIQVVVTKRS